MSSPEVSIIIVNWNGHAFLPKCLRSIVENPPSNTFEIVVVDNASTDGSGDWLKSAECSRLLFGTPFRVLEPGENLGFGRANNLAFDATSSRYLFLLNPDSEVRPAAIDNLIAALNPAQKLGMSVPKVIGLDGSIQRNLWYIPSALRFLSEGLGVSKIVPNSVGARWYLSNEIPRHQKVEVPLASGCAMMVVRELISTVGGFNPAIFMYGEDAEWCYRIGKHGWKIIFEPSAEIIHTGGQSSIQKWGESETRLKEVEAYVNFEETCLPTSRFVAVLLVKLSLMLPNYLLSLLRKKENETVRRAVLAQLDGLRRAFRKYI
jgi:GT2 family glycosyltransferase